MINKAKLENLAGEIWKGAIKLRGKIQGVRLSVGYIADDYDSAD